MKTLVVSLNRERIPDVVAPIGCAYVMETLIRNGHEAEFLDLLRFPSPQEALLGLEDKIRVLNPEWVILSVRNLDRSVEPQRANELPWIRQTVQTIQNTGVPLLVGGSGFSLLPERFLQELGLEVGLAGPCEQSLPLFLQHHQQRREWHKIPGLVWKDPQTGNIQMNASKPWGIPNEAPFLGWSKMDPAFYYQEGGAINVQTKRGCAFRCSFCTYPKLEGKTVLERSAMGVADELAYWVEQYGIRHFFFVDSVFNAPKHHVDAILMEIIRRELKISWTAYINPLGLDATTIRLMLRSGCVGVEMGIDSGSDSVLRKLKKGFLAVHIERALALCESEGLKVCINLIFGSAGENQQTVTETILLMEKFRNFPVISMVGVRIYPGTPIYVRALEENVVSPEHDFLEPTFYFSNQFNQSCMDLLVQQAKERQNWVIPDAHVNTNLEFFQMLRKRQMKGPLWRVLRPGPKVEQASSKKWPGEEAILRAT